METKIPLPDLGEDAPDEAKLSFFFVEEGDEIQEGDDLAEMVTDKATFNVPSPVTGVVKKLVVEEDETVKVGAPLAIVEVAQG